MLALRGEIRGDDRLGTLEFFAENGKISDTGMNSLNHYALRRGGGLDI